MKQIFAVSTLSLLCLAPAGSPHWYTPLKSTQWWLVVAAFSTLFVIGWQAVETRRAAEETKRAAEATQKSTAAIERQAGIMEQQTKAMETAAEAAKANAVAAIDTIELFKSKERGRLTVEVDDLIWEHSPTPPVTTTLKGVYYRIRFFGPTPVFIETSGVSAFVYDSAQDYGKDLSFAIGIPKIVSANTELAKLHARIFSISPRNLDLSDDEIGGIQCGRLSVRFRGFVRYRDAFDITRETKFDYLWREPGLPFLRGWWKQFGTSQDNIET